MYDNRRETTGALFSLKTSSVGFKVERKTKFTTPDPEISGRPRLGGEGVESALLLIRKYQGGQDWGEGVESASESRTLS